MNSSKIIMSIFLAFLFCQILTAQQTNFRALLVGIADYPGTDNDISPANTVNDANDMAYYLEHYQGWSSNNIEVKLNSYATASEITSYISNMPNTRGTSELFFYSGHGTTDGAYTYSGNLSPSDLQSSFGSSYDQFCCIINACHSGTFINNMSKGELLTSCQSNELSYINGPDDNCIYSY